MTNPFFFNRWKPEDPSIIQLFSLATPNGRKVSIALEEMKLPYESHTIDTRSGIQFSNEYKSLNPNSKIPAIWDPNGPDNQPVTLMESGAILLYLAEKTEKLLPQQPLLRYECLEWLFFQMASIGPMFGQFGHFHKYAAETCTHPYPKERYFNEVRRLLNVLEERLEGRQYLVADQYTIADISIFPWVGCMDWGLKARNELSLNEFKKVMVWHDLCASKPASEKGSQVCTQSI
jgi:GST-like protein